MFVRNILTGCLQCPFNHLCAVVSFAVKNDAMYELANQWQKMGDWQPIYSLRSQSPLLQQLLFFLATVERTHHVSDNKRKKITKETRRRKSVSEN